MKKYFRLLLMTPLMLGLSMGITSCSDDDDDNSTPRNADADPEDTEEQRAALHWITAIGSVQELSGNWQSKTYEPVIGRASENNPNNRLVVVADMDEARQHFAGLADVDVNELGSEKTVSYNGVGGMTWTPSPSGAQNLAEVTVNIKAIPKLQKIVYCTTDQIGQNGIFSDNVKGTAYYRFGDVIRDKQGYYWVCVRPSFQIDDKGDSHWINIINANILDIYTTNDEMPNGTVYTKYNKKYNNKTILFPTKLPYNREHIYNLANLVRALQNPTRYHEAVGDEGKGLGGFPYRYHDVDFLKRVGQAWTNTRESNLDIWHLLFNSSMEDITNLHFYYYGYSWIFGDEATLYEYQQDSYKLKMTGSRGGDEKGYKVKETGFDVNRYIGHKDADKTAAHDQFVGSNGYWVVRYKKGDDLATDGTYTPYSEIPGCTDVYRYYHDVISVSPGTDLEKALEKEKDVQVSNDNPQIGNIIAANGNIYSNYNDPFGDSTNPVGMIVFIGKSGDYDTDENTKTLNYLCISTEPANESPEDTFSWGPTTGKCLTPIDIDQANGYTNLIGLLNGINSTNTLVKDGHDHPAALQSKNFTELTTLGRIVLNIRNDGFGPTQYFLPSVGQWVQMMKGLDIWEKNTDYNTVSKRLKELYDKAKVPEYNRLPMDGTGIWTSSEASETQAYKMTIKPGEGAIFSKEKKDSKLKVFPFIIWGY